MGSREKAELSYDFNCTGHVLAARCAVEAAVVGKPAGLLEAVLEAAAADQRFRLERAVVGLDRMTAGVVEPLHGCAGLDGHFLWREGKVGQLDGSAPGAASGGLRRGRLADMRDGRDVP